MNKVKKVIMHKLQTINKVAKCKANKAMQNKANK